MGSTNETRLHKTCCLITHVALYLPSLGSAFMYFIMHVRVTFDWPYFDKPFSKPFSLPCIYIILQ